MKEGKGFPRQRAVLEILDDKDWYDAPNRAVARELARRAGDPKEMIEVWRKAVGYYKGSNGYNSYKDSGPGTPYVLPTSCTRILIVGDLQIPFHVQAAVDEALSIGEDAEVNTIVLNGDVNDGFELGRFLKTSKHPLEDELEQTRAFLDLVKEKFPKAAIYYKEGNHEDRMERYISRNAPELLGITEWRWDVLCQLGQRKIEWINEKRPIIAGEWPIIHGHEFLGFSDGGLYPAKWLMQKLGGPGITNHFHRTNHYYEDYLGTDRSTYSVGCLCGLKPDWRPMQPAQKTWNHGCLTIIDNVVTNYRL